MSKGNNIFHCLFIKFGFVDPCFFLYLSILCFSEKRSKKRERISEFVVIVVSVTCSRRKDYPVADNVRGLTGLLVVLFGMVVVVVVV